MDAVLREGDIVTVAEYGRFAIVKTIEFNKTVYHYIIKIKEDIENPEVLFVSEKIDMEDNLDLVPVKDNALFNKLIEVVRKELNG